MIVFDLACEAAGHVFEAWFGSTGDYEAQRSRGLVSCPVCGDARVTKALMTPRISAKGNAAPPPVTKAAPGAPPAEAIKALMTAMAKAQNRMLAKSDYMGDRFAAEARAIHLGESEQRSIHGVATPSQARSLIEDGIEVAPLPFPVREPGTEH